MSPALEAILHDLRPAAVRLARERRSPRRARRVGLVSVAVGLVLTGTVAAGVSLFGGPAPDRVKRDIAAVDQGMPPDLRLNPDVEHARTAAVSGDTTVYFAPLLRGGYCAEMVIRGRAAGATCTTDPDGQGVSVTVPFVDPVTDTSPVSVSGHVSVPGAIDVQIVYPDGASDVALLSPDRFYAGEVPGAHLRVVHRHGLLVVARDGDGKIVGQAVVPSDAITPPSEADRPHDPIEVTTVSDHRDFRLVLGISGDVQIADAVQVEIRYPDGTSALVPVRNGRFRYEVPQDRQLAFADTPGMVIVRDARGAALGDREVASVAYWRSGG